MKKYLLLFLVFLSTQLFSAQITETKARKIAKNFYLSVSGDTSRCYLVLQNDEFFVYNFTHGQHKGFVWVRADDNLKPIQGYSKESHFPNPKDTTHAFINYFNRATEIVRAAKYLKYNPKSPQWNILENGKMPMRLKASQTVQPLTTAMYDQYPYYNKYCPVNKVDNSQCVTGCVSTGMVIIMRYWQWPPTGTGNLSYCDCTPNFSVNIGVLSSNLSAHNYNWAGMPLTGINASNCDGIAQAMYDAGVAVQMDYNDPQNGGSGAFGIGGAPSAQVAFHDNFGYQPVTGIQESSYTSAKWDSIMKAELLASRPMNFQAFDPNAGGHYFVCDGFDANDLFHFNFGWSSSGNGYYSLSAINVDGFQFNTDVGALIGIYPGAGYVPPTPNPCKISSFTFTNITTSSITASWTALNDSFSIIRYQVSGSSTWTTIPSIITGTTATIASLIATTTYNVRRVNFCKGGGVDSTTGSATTASAPCLPPTNFVAIPTADGAYLSWAPGQSNQYWDLMYGLFNGSTVSAYNTVHTPFDTIRNQPPNTKFLWYTQDHCAGGTVITEPASSFTTLGSSPPPCNPPIIFSNGAIDTTHAFITWGALSGATSYNFQYKGAGAANWTTVSTLSPNISLANLIPATVYNYQAQTVCNSGTSIFSAANSFTTQSRPIPPPSPTICPFVGSAAYEYIKTSVINGNTASPGDVVYTNSTTPITLKATNSFTFTPGFTGNSWPEVWSVYLYSNGAWTTLYKSGPTNTVLIGTFSCTNFSSNSILRVEISWQGANGTSCNSSAGGTCVDFNVTFNSATMLPLRK